MADINKLKNRARREEQRENWAAAIEFYTRALRASEKDRDSAADFSLYNRIGDIHLRLGDVESAVASYERAIARYAEHDLHTSAIAVCNKVLRIQPSRIATYLRLAQLQLATGLMAEARVNYLRYATELLTRGENDKAYGALEEYVERSGDLGSALRFAGALVANGRSEEALELLLRLREQTEASGGDVEALRKPIEAIRSFEGGRVARPQGEAQLRAGRDPEAEAATAAGPPAPPAPREKEEDLEGVGGIALLEAELEAAVGPDAAVEPDAAAGPRASAVEPASAGAVPEPAGEPAPEPAGEPAPEPAGEPAPEPAGARSETGRPVETAPEAADSEWAEIERVEVPPASRRVARRPIPPEAPEGPAELVAHGPGGAGDYGAEALELDPQGQRAAARTEVPTEDAEPAEVGIDDRRIPAGASPEDSEVTSEPLPLLPERERVRAMRELEEAASSQGERGEETLPEKEEVEGPLVAPVGRASAARPAGASPDPPEEEVRAAFASPARPVEPEGAERPTTPAIPPGGAVPFPTEGEALSVPEPPALRPVEAEAPEPRRYLAPERAESEPSVEMGAETGVEGRPEQPVAREPVEGGAVEPLAVGFPGERSAAEPPEEGAEEDGHELWEGLESGEPDAYLEHFERGLALKESGDLEGAIREFEQAAESPACFLPAFRMLQECLDLQESAVSVPEAAERPGEAEEVGDLEEEIAPASTASKELVPESVGEPSPESAGFETAAGSEAAGGLVGGVEVDEPAGQTVPDDGFRQWLGGASLDLLARALEELERRGENRKALQVVERMIELEPARTSLHRRRIAYCTEIGQDDALPEAYLGLAAALEEAGELEGARAAFERAAELDSANEAALEGLARLGRRAESPAAPAATLRGDDDPKGRTGGTELSEEWGEDAAEPREEEGEIVLRFSATTVPAAGDARASAPSEEEWDGPIPYDRRAVAREGVVDFDVILAELKEQLADGVADEGDGRSRTEVGERLKEMGLLDDAIRELQAAVRSPDAPPRAFELLGDAFIEKGQARVATRLLAEALQRLSAGTEEELLLGVLYQLGVAYQEVGDRTRALECYERIFSVDIDYRDVRDRIESCAA